MSGILCLACRPLVSIFELLERLPQRIRLVPVMLPGWRAHVRTQTCLELVDLLIQLHNAFMNLLQAHSNSYVKLAPLVAMQEPKYGRPCSHSILPAYLPSAVLVLWLICPGRRRVVKQQSSPVARNGSAPTVLAPTAWTRPTAAARPPCSSSSQRSSGCWTGADHLRLGDAHIRKFVQRRRAGLERGHQ
jgi:hypothetical protein